MQVLNGTGPGDRRSKRSLLASRTRCKCSMETPRNKAMTSKTVIRSSSVTMSRFCEMSYQLIDGVTVYRYGHVPECHVTFWRGDFIMFDETPISTIELP